MSLVNYEQQKKNTIDDVNSDCDLIFCNYLCPVSEVVYLFISAISSITCESAFPNTAI